MTEHMKKFLEAVSSNSELVEKIGSMTKDELMALAKELDIELAEADFVKSVTELSDDELDAVGGGDVCACVMGGGTVDGSSTSDVSDAVCACVLGGGGKNKGGYTRCVCVLGGGGRSVVCSCIGNGVG